MKRVGVRVHVQRINRKIIRSDVKRLEHLRQRQKLPVSENHELVAMVTKLALDVTIASRTDSCQVMAWGARAVVQRKP